MEYLQQVEAGIDYIETHLGFGIEFADVDHTVGISRWYFQRILKQLAMKP